MWCNMLNEQFVQLFQWKQKKMAKEIGISAKIVVNDEVQNDSFESKTI